MNQISPLQSSSAASDWDFIDSMDSHIFGNPYHITLQPGFELVVVDFSSAAASRQVFFVESSPVELSFHLRGHGAGELCYGLRQKEEVNIDPGVAVLSHCPETKCTTIIPENEVVKALHIYMDMETLTKFFPPEAASLPKEILSLIESSGDKNRKNSRPFYICTPINPRAYMVLQQLFTCPCQGPVKRLYLEAKAMELVALQMETMTGSSCKKSMPLTRQDRERIYAARDILLNNLDHLPSLAELAQKSGLNQTKLKKGFREVFHTTVIGCVNEYRLDQSRKLLEQGELTVSEVAYQLGFYDPTHFIRHFKARFGVTPGVWMKSRRIF